MDAADSSGGYVFGYGSLVAPGAPGAVAALRGHARAWNVAMDNAATIPGYKYYAAPDGTRPAVFVVFLNIVADARADVNGVAFPVSAADLARLDERERNYRRVEATDAVEPQVGAPVWTYVGLDEARGRFERGRRERRCAISRSYHDAVISGFRARGDAVYRDFERSTQPPTCPIRELEPVPLPDAPER